MQFQNYQNSYLLNFIIGKMGLHWPCVIHWAEMDLACFCWLVYLYCCAFYVNIPCKKNSLKENEQ